MAFEPHRSRKTLLLVGLVCSCASGRAIPPAPEPDPEPDCRQTAPNLIHVVRSVEGPAAKKDSYEYCVSHDGTLLFEHGSAPTHRGRINNEQLHALQELLVRASKRQSQEVAHSCTHTRSLLVEWMWSGRYFAAHEACDETQPVVATEVRDAAWSILKLERVKAQKK